MGGGFLCPLVWSMSGSDTRVETYGQGTTHDTPRPFKQFSTFTEKMVFNKMATYPNTCRNSSGVDCYWRFIKALLQMIDIKLILVYFFPAAIRTGSGWFCWLSALSVTLSESKCEGISWNPPVLQQHQGQPLYVSIFTPAYKDFCKCHVNLLERWELRDMCL